MGQDHASVTVKSQQRADMESFFFSPFSPAALALEGRRKEPMLTGFLLHCEAPLEEEEERPPSTESSSSKFLSGEGVEKQRSPDCTTT